MSSSEESLDSGTPGGTKSSRVRNPALWGLVGVLAGSLVSGAFSLYAADKAYQASESSRIGAQQSFERGIEEENKRKRDEFLRDQRVTAYKQFLTDSRLLEDAQADYLAALAQPERYDVNTYLTALETTNRQFVNSAWGMEFFSPEKLKEDARTLTQELYARYLALTNYRPSIAEWQALTQRVNGTRDKVSELRQKFADSASQVLSS
ncbi:UNVERIFIED_ORG: hypothetical protein J2X79_002007 [Arthrobacter globiformis]|nr:hypothetical protein [Arthrobacter globiformis]